MIDPNTVMLTVIALCNAYGIWQGARTRASVKRVEVATDGLLQARVDAAGTIGTLQGANVARGEAEEKALALLADTNKVLRAESDK